MSSPRIRALVVEDSPTARELLVEILRSDPEVEVVGTAANGLEAVKMTKLLQPHVVTMDVRMPHMDGFEATRAIMAEAPTPIVIVTATLNVRDVEVSLHALRLGALTLLPRPSGPASPTFDDERRQLVQTVKALSQVRVVRHRIHRPLPSLPVPPRRSARARVVAVAASTGGPAALARLLGDLSPEFALPVLIVQHMATGFVEGFAAWLNVTSAIRVKVAEDGEPISPRTAYVAPDGRHLALRDRKTLAISDSEAIGGFRPSGTFLFDSVAQAFGNAAVGVILTGMGRDGVAGLRAIHAAGGVVLAQSEESSIVFGMPGAAIADGVAHEVLDLSAIGARLGELASRQEDST